MTLKNVFQLLKAAFLCGPYQRRQEGITASRGSSIAPQIEA